MLILPILDHFGVRIFFRNQSGSSPILQKSHFIQYTVRFCQISQGISKNVHAYFFTKIRPMTTENVHIESIQSTVCQKQGIFWQALDKRLRRLCSHQSKAINHINQIEVNVLTLLARGQVHWKSLLRPRLGPLREY